MFRNALHLSLALVLLAGWFSTSSAQEEKKEQPPPPPVPREDYREFFRRPETPQDFWRAIRFELEVGRPDLAARLLRAMIEKKPDDKDLLDIEEKEGISSFLRLLTIPQWDKDPKVNEQAKKDAQELVERATAALKSHLGDPGRIKRLIANLTGDPDERAYAMKELYRSGAAAVPHLIEVLRHAEGAERYAILSALPKLSRDIEPPLMAALDIEDPALRVELIEVLHRRGAVDAVPYLWYFSASPKQPERVRQKATAALAYLLNTPPSKLPSAKVALAKEAERYYNHQVAFVDPRAVRVWRWDGERLVEGWPPKATTVPASKAEEYYGLRFAGQALDLDPTYQPAQVVFLSIALEKAVEQAGFDQPLAWGAPEVGRLAATVNPELLTAVLDRALNERRLPVILGAVRALGDLADVRAARPMSEGTPALVRALYYPDRRVQLAAAEALLRIPGLREAPAPARVVEILRRAAALDPAAKQPPKVLVGYFNADVAAKVAEAVSQAGFQPVLVQTGRQVMHRLSEAADIDAILIESELPDPGLSLLLGQLRADSNVGRLPLLVAVPREREGRVRSLTTGYPNVRLVPATLVLDADGLRQALGAVIADSGSPPLSEEERRRQAEKALSWLARLARGQVRGYDIRPAAATLLSVLRESKLGEEAITAAIEAVGRLPGAAAQIELANVVLDAGKPGRTPALRTIAAQELARNIQQYGPALPAGMVRALEEMGRQETDAGLRSAVAVVLGSMRPDARLTGERLKSFTPSPFPPEVPAKEPPPEKEKDKD